MKSLLTMMLSATLIFPLSAAAGFKNKGLVALGTVGIASAVSKSKAYKPPTEITHAVDSNMGYLRQPVYGSLICVVDKGGAGADDMYGLIFHSEGRTTRFPVHTQLRYTNLENSWFQVYSASETESGRQQGSIPLELDGYSKCPQDWDWSIDLIPVEALPEFKSKAEIAAEKKAIEDAKKAEAASKRQAEIDSGKIVVGPANSEAWISKAKSVTEELQAKYPVYKEVWPALAVLVERMRDQNTVPTPSTDVFSEICKNKFDKENKKKKATYGTNFGFDCKSIDETWANLLSWYHPELKDYSASSDWSDFGYYREPQKLLFTGPENTYAPVYDTSLNGGRGAACPLKSRDNSKKPVSITHLKSLEAAGCMLNPYRGVSYQIKDETILASYHYLFDLAERFNMHVAALVTGDTGKYASESSLQQTLKLAKKQIRGDLFESISSEEDIQMNINLYGLYPELLDLYVAMAGGKGGLEDEVQAYFDALEEAHVSTPAERAYRDFYELVAVTEACYDYGRSRALVYIDYSQYNKVKEIWSGQKKSSGLNKSELQAVHELIDEDPSRQSVYRTIRGESYQDYWADKCRRTYRQILTYE